MKSGRYNVGIGLLTMSLFMAYGFLLIYLRDFHPDRESWIAGYTTGVHFESRLAHVHGNLFGLLNVGLGFLLSKLDAAPARGLQTVAVLGLVGLMMPLGIVGEIYLGLSPIFVLLGALSMILSVAVGGVLSLRYWPRSGALVAP